LRERTISTDRGKELTVDFIELVDLFLLGTVLYLIALGLYELFIDDTLPTPKWLHVEDLDDLKRKLIAVIIVLLGVTFLGSAVSWKGGIDILYYGIAIAAMLVPLSAVLFLSGRAKARQNANEAPD
jgi:uncharacterized membrane protein YqhA